VNRYGIEYVLYTLEWEMICTREHEAKRDHWYLWDLRGGRLHGATVRLSANTGVCEDMKGGEYEAEREHWYLL
jgi:hypothetical protein